MSEKTLVSLIDSNFAGRDVLNMPGVDFGWCTENKLISKHVFFTDYKLNYVDKIKHNNIKKVAWLVEPRAIVPNSYSYIEQHYYKFDYILSFDENICRLPNALYAPYGTYWVKKTDKQKTKKISMIASNKGWTEGHKIRLSCVDNVTGIDYYGACVGKKIKEKNEGLDDYMFSVAIENSIQDTYFTEKIIDCFATKTAPIYWGTKNISKFFNKDGIIFFNTIDELKNILNNLTREKYESMKHAIDENYNAVGGFHIPEQYIQRNYNFLLN